MPILRAVNNEKVPTNEATRDNRQLVYKGGMTRSVMLSLRKAGVPEQKPFLG